MERSASIFQKSTKKRKYYMLLIDKIKLKKKKIKPYTKRRAPFNAHLRTCTLAHKHTCLVITWWKRSTSYRSDKWRGSPRMHGRDAQSPGRETWILTGHTKWTYCTRYSKNYVSCNNELTDTNTIDLVKPKYHRLGEAPIKGSVNNTNGTGPNHPANWVAKPYTTKLAHHHKNIRSQWR